MIRKLGITFVCVHMCVHDIFIKGKKFLVMCDASKENYCNLSKWIWDLIKRCGRFVGNCTKCDNGLSNV